MAAVVFLVGSVVSLIVSIVSVSVFGAGLDTAFRIYMFSGIALALLTILVSMRTKKSAKTEKAAKKPSQMAAPSLA